jgi:hypothetical protein
VLACVLHYVEQQIALEDKTTSKAIVEIRTLSVVATIRQLIHCVSTAAVLSSLPFLGTSNPVDFES